MQLTLSPEELRALLDPWIRRVPLDLDALTPADWRRPPIDAQADAQAERGMLEGAIETRRVALERLDDQVRRTQTELARLEELTAQSKAEASDAMVWQRLEEIAETLAVHVSEQGLAGFSDAGFKFWNLETRRLAAALCSTLGVDVEERQELRAALEPCTHPLEQRVRRRFGAECALCGWRFMGEQHPAGGTVRVSHPDSDEVVALAKARELVAATAKRFVDPIGETWVVDMHRLLRDLAATTGAPLDETTKARLEPIEITVVEPTPAVDEAIALEIADDGIQF
jgi:hypothetical protein